MKRKIFIFSLTKSRFGKLVIDGCILSRKSDSHQFFHRAFSWPAVKIVDGVDAEPCVKLSVLTGGIKRIYLPRHMVSDVFTMKKSGNPIGTIFSGLFN